MKGLILLLAIVAICMARPVADNDYSEFIVGFLRGVHEKGDVKKLTDCIKDGTEIIKKVKAALVELPHPINEAKLKKALPVLLEGMKDMLAMLKPCADSFDVLKKLTDAIGKAEIAALIKKIIAQPREFTHGVDAANNCFGKNNFTCAGRAIGDVMRFLFLVKAQANPGFDFVKGFLEGIHETKKVEDLEKCLKDINQIIEKIKVALEYFMKMTFDDLVKGFKLLIEAIKDLEAMLKPCLEGFNQVKKLLEAITHADILKIIGKIIVNPGAFIHDIKDCIEAVKKLDMYTAGKDLGDILYRLFLTRATVEPLQAFLEGFLKGIHEVKSIDDLIKCIGEANKIIERIMAALELIKKFTIESLLQGLTLLFDSIFDLEEMLRPCLSEFTQFRKLIEAMMNSDINELIQKIIQNAFQFIADIIDCIQSFEKGDYVQAGKDLGDILYKLFLVEADKGIDVGAFLKGFLEGINEKGDVEHLLKCVKDLENIIVKIMQAVEYIKKGDFINLIKGITMLLEAVGELLNNIKPCADGFEQIKKLINAISHVNIKDLIFKILKDPGPYIAAVSAAIEAFKANDFHKAGYFIGQVLYNLFLTSA